MPVDAQYPHKQRLTPWTHTWTHTSRDRGVSRARLMVIWLARKGGRIPVAQAAKFFGRDTSTMINNLNHFKTVLENDSRLRDTLLGLKEQICRSTPNTP